MPFGGPFVHVVKQPLRIVFRFCFVAAHFGKYDIEWKMTGAFVMSPSLFPKILTLNLEFLIVYPFLDGAFYKS